MARLPDFGEFTATFFVAQLIYAFALFPFAYCLLKHPLFPTWLAVCLFLDGVFWIAYYWANVNKFAYLLSEALAWGPSFIIESLVGLWFIRAGLTLKKLSKPPLTSSEAKGGSDGAN